MIKVWVYRAMIPKSGNLFDKIMRKEYMTRKQRRLILIGGSLGVLAIAARWY